MTRDDRALFERLKDAHEREAREKLEAAKREAAARGKEPFDLDRLDAIYPGSPGGGGDRALREREYERIYYVDYAHVDTIGELAITLWQLDHGEDPSGDRSLAVRLADRAKRRGVSSDPERLREAIACYEQLAALIPAGEDEVPASELSGMFGREWRTLAPHRFRRADIARAIEATERRLAELEPSEE